MCLTTAMFCGPLRLRSLARSSWRDDIENPMQSVLDAPVGADGRRKGFGIERYRGEVVSPFSRDRIISLDARFDHANHGQMGEARFVGIAAIREQPAYVMADDMVTLLDPAVIAVGRVMLGLQHIGGRIIEELHHVLVENRPIGLQRQQVIATTPDDLFRDVGLCPHGVDGNERPGQFQPFEQQRNGDDLVGLLVNGLLTEDKALTSRPGGHQMQWLATFTTRMASPRCLAVDGNDVGRTLAQRLDPVSKAGLEQFRV